MSRKFGNTVNSMQKKMKKIDITDNEIEALRVCKEWGIGIDSWAYNHLVELYSRIVEQLEKDS